MAVIDAEPLCIFFETDGDPVLVGLPVDAFVSDSRVALEMRGHISGDCFRYFWEFLVGLLCRLLHLALLAGEVKERPLQSFGDEVGGNAFLADLGCRDDLFKVLAGSARLDEGLLLFVLMLSFVGGIGLGQGDVLRALDSA